MEYIHGYVTDDTNRRTGVLFAAKIGDKVVISGSKANTKVDKFNAKIGIEIAAERVVSFVADNRTIKLPACMWADVQHFADRCRRYFHTDAIVMPKIKDYLLTNP